MSEVCKCKAHLAIQPLLIDDFIFFRGRAGLTNIHAPRSNGEVNLKYYKLPCGADHASGSAP